MAALKRIFFESQTLVLSSLRQPILDPDSTAKQKLPEAEKSQRLLAFKTANPGLYIDATSEPRHSLLELACEQERQNVLRHIPIEKCAGRQHEILNHQKCSTSVGRLLLQIISESASISLSMRTRWFLCICSSRVLSPEPTPTAVMTWTPPCTMPLTATKCRPCSCPSQLDPSANLRPLNVFLRAQAQTYAP